MSNFTQIIISGPRKKKNTPSVASWCINYHKEICNVSNQMYFNVNNSLLSNTNLSQATSTTCTFSKSWSGLMWIQSLFQEQCVWAYVLYLWNMITVCFSHASDLCAFQQWSGSKSCIFQEIHPSNRMSQGYSFLYSWITTCTMTEVLWHMWYPLYKGRDVQHTGILFRLGVIDDSIRNCQEIVIIEMGIRLDDLIILQEMWFLQL